MRKKILLILLILIASIVIGCSKNEVEEPSMKLPETDVLDTEEIETRQEMEDETNDEESGEKAENLNTEEERELSMEKEAKQNAEKHPAKPGAVLVTKGGHNFTGMNYYFKGEIVAVTHIENNVGNPDTWLVKNENGYVMPVQHGYFEGEIGDTVEIWGTLTGNGYSNLEGINNVVGETGSMHAMIVDVNGERQY